MFHTCPCGVPFEAASYGTVLSIVLNGSFNGYMYYIQVKSLKSRSVTIKSTLVCKGEVVGSLEVV